MGGYMKRKYSTLDLGGIQPQDLINHLVGENLG